MEDLEGLTGMAPREKSRPDVPAANPTDVAFEQFEGLVEHVASGFCVGGCHDCALFLAVRRLLLERFEPTKHNSSWR